MTLFTQRKWDRSSLGSIQKYTVFTRDRFQIGTHSFLGSIEKKAHAYCLCHQLVCRQIEKKMTSNLKSWQTKCLFGAMKKRMDSGSIPSVPCEQKADPYHFGIDPGLDRSRVNWAYISFMEK